MGSNRISTQKSYRKNKAARNARSLEYQKENPDRTKAWRRVAYLNQKPKIKARLAADPMKRQKLRAAISKWERENRDHRAAYYHQRRARIAGNGGRYSPAEWNAAKAYFNCRCAYCLEPMRLVREHMTPLSRGGRNDDENIVPSCGRCNSSKGNRTLLEWLASDSQRRPVAGIF